MGILVNNAIKVTFRRIHVNPQITSFELMEAVLTICSISLRLSAGVSLAAGGRRDRRLHSL